MPAALPDPHILIIDDEPANVTLLQAILRRAGYSRLVGFTDPALALAAANASPPDLVLLDLNMPMLDGYEVTRRLRRDQQPNSFLPILILTADITPAARQRALSGGATDFVTKPFDNTEVLQRCRNLLETRALQIALHDQNTRLEELVQQRTQALEKTLSELRDSQQHLVAQERLRALGEMSGGIAEDFSNQLTALLGYTDLLLLNEAQMLSNKLLARKYLENIRTAAHESSAIVSRLREFSRSRASGDMLLPVNLSKVVQDAATLTQPRWRSQALAAGSQINVRLDLQPVPDVPGDAAELRQVIANLIFNAVDGMPEGGTITLHTSRNEDGGACLEVSDTGIGMSDEIHRRCLEPFFTTKNEAGRGLGLSMVYGAVQRHDGKLNIHTSPGEGVRITICLPAVAEEVEKALPEAVGPHSTKSLRVLLVEDDPAAREVVGEYLRRHMHEVATAVTGREGLEMFLDGEFDLVVTDLSLQELNGEGLATAIRAHDARVPIILVTGYAGQMVETKHFDAVLRKPLIFSEFWRTIARVTAPAEAIAAEAA